MNQINKLKLEILFMSMFVYSLNKCAVIYSEQRLRNELM